MALPWHQHASWGNDVISQRGINWQDGKPRDSWDGIDVYALDHLSSDVAAHDSSRGVATVSKNQSEPEGPIVALKLSGYVGPRGLSFDRSSHPCPFRSGDVICLLEGGFSLLSGMHQHLIRLDSRSLNLGQLTPYGLQGASRIPDTPKTSRDQQKIGEVSNPVIIVSRRECYPDGIGLTAALFIAGIGLESWAIALLCKSQRNRWGWLLAGLSLAGWIGGCLRIYIRDKANAHDPYYCQQFQHDSEIVPQKNLDPTIFAGYNKYTASILNTDKQIAVVAAMGQGPASEQSSA